MSESDCFRPIAGPFEPYTGYKMGGYHPVHFYDVFDNRYTVLRKLGYGYNATVWLALDSW